MGWASGKIDGKHVGYAVEDTCNHPGCTKHIDRGLAYACGGEHGTTEDHCDGYFCSKHLYAGEDGVFRCAECTETNSEVDK